MNRRTEVRLLNTLEIVKAIVPLTLPELVRRERLTRTQASRVRDGLKWAEWFGLLQHTNGQYDLGDLKTALVLSIIIEAARRV